MRFLARWLPQRVLVNSRATLATLQPIDLRRVQVVHPGVPAALLTRRIARADGEAAPIVGIVGRISPRKGQDVFLRAAAPVAEGFPQASFQIIGGALFGHEAYERELRALAAQLGGGGGSSGQQHWGGRCRAGVRTQSGERDADSAGGDAEQPQPGGG